MADKSRLRQWQCMGLVFGFLVGMVWPKGSAHAFVCSRVEGEGAQGRGASLSWFSRRLSFTLQAAGTADITGNGERVVLRNAFDVWKNVTLGAASQSECGSSLGPTDLILEERTPITSTFVGYNYLEPAHNENLLIFQDAGWPHPDGAGLVIALTTATFSVANGEILDADIEFNSANFAFVATLPSGNQMDLANTAVHEIGHFLGLAHSPVETATMYYRAPPTETEKADLDCDDARAINLKYPSGQPNGYCPSTPAETCGYCASFTLSSTHPNFRQTDGDANFNDDGGCHQVPGGLLPWAACAVAALAWCRRCQRAFSSGRTNK